MKKIGFAWMVCMGLCIAASGKAGTLFQAEMPKQTLTEREEEFQNIYTKPEGFRITRQSALPWDDAETKWSILVELENISEDTIVLDENDLRVCNADGEELGRWYVSAMDGAFWTTGRVVKPKERVVLFSGTDEIKTWVSDAQTGQVVEKVLFSSGLEGFASQIQRAEGLRIRLDTRLNAQTQGHREAVSGIRTWIENGRLHMEKTDAFHSEDFLMVTVLVTDGEGRLLDALQGYASENFSAEKELAPYVDAMEQKDLRFEMIGYKIP